MSSSVFFVFVYKLSFCVQKSIKTLTNLETQYISKIKPSFSKFIVTQNSPQESVCVSIKFKS